MFYHILKALAALEYSNVFAIDWLGMGRSSRPTSGLMSGQGYPQRSLFSLRRQKQEVADECIDYFVESLEKWREEMKVRVNVITVAEFRSHPLNSPAVADDER